MLAKIRGIAASLNHLATRLSETGHLSPKDEAVILLTDSMLRQEPFLSLFVSDTSLSELSPNLVKISLSSAKRSNDSDFSENEICGDKLIQSWSSGLERGLDEAYDLDWDSEGIELSGSSYLSFPDLLMSDNPYAIAFTSDNRYGRDADDKLSDKHSLAVSRETTPCCSSTPSYQGMYETFMEMSLEQEEGFYSDEDESNQNVDIMKHDETVSVSVIPMTTHSRDGQTHPQAEPVMVRDSVYRLIDIGDDANSLSSDLSVTSSPLTSRYLMGPRTRIVTANISHKRCSSTTPPPSKEVLLLSPATHRKVLRPSSRSPVFV